MKCRDCTSCRLGWSKSNPDKYVCIGVKRPFYIDDINHECTEYSCKNAEEKTQRQEFAHVNEE